MIKYKIYTTENNCHESTSHLDNEITEYFLDNLINLPFTPSIGMHIALWDFHNDLSKEAQSVLSNCDSYLVTKVIMYKDYTEVWVKWYIG